MKIAIIITSQIFIRNYLSDLFIDEHGCDEFVVMLRKGLVLDDNYKEKQTEYKVGIIQNFISKILFKIELLKKINRSKTFKFRISRSFYWPEIRYRFGVIGEADREIKIDDFFEIIKLAGKFVLAVIYHVGLLPFIFLPKCIFSKLIAASEGELGWQLKKMKPDLIIFPFTGYEVEQNYLPYIAKKINSKLVFCTDNWDNMSSKTVLSFMPDMITVWGDQTRRHAIEIQGVPENRVKIAPSPRLKVYIDAFPNLEKKMTVGFVGSFLSFDEIEALEILEGILDERSNLTGEDWKILYRPHPWRMAESEFNRLSKLKRVNLIEEFRSVYKDNSWGTKFQPNLSGYLEYFKQCDFVVGGLTTMLIEALLCKRRVVGIGYWDKKYNLYSPGSALENYQHFEGIDKYENMKIAKTKEEYSELIRKELDGIKFIDSKEVRNLVCMEDLLTLSKVKNL